MESCRGPHYFARRLEALSQSYRRADRATVCKALCEEQQGRRERYRSDLRGRFTPKHALRACEERGATGARQQQVNRHFFFGLVFQGMLRPF
jgi:hypothetical protein